MYQKYLKRTFDTTVSLIVLMLALPVGIIVAALIKIDSKGPTIFKQKRTGKNGSIFNMYKFRTMTCDNNVHDTKQANKLTTLGKIIRALSLDEIPQFINILKGEMSLIGPRPWIPEYYNHMTDKQRQRNSVRPGITGLAQARGRNNLTVFDKINYDLLYIQRITFTNDVKIIVLTILALFEKTGAAIEKHAIHFEIEKLRLQHSNTLATDSGVFFSELPNNKSEGEDRIKRNREGLVISHKATGTHNITTVGSNSSKRATNNSKYTVLMSVYAKERPEFLLESVMSMLNQTLKPNEILILKDGQLSFELEEVLDRLSSSHENIRIVGFDENRGLGPVLADGVKLAKNDLIARMDSDDISNPERCELQLNEFVKDPSLDVVGSNVTEFIDKPNNIIAQRVMPKTNSEIVSFSKKRNPLAHPSVMFKKETVLEAGNYRDFKQCEDYDLWIRMIKNGAKCHNIQKFLVYMRISPDFYARRGGLTYVKHILKFKRELLLSGHYSYKDFIVSGTSSAAVGLMPNFMRSKLYSRFLRAQSQPIEEV
jgi:lipopolysaccharide/colanic/teichoic acid biosynthesis glycosyltransferase/glycosyltransferase involved in cell wall biosynthesis